VRDNFRIYGKIGFAQVDIDLGFSGQSSSYDDTGVLFGAGLVVDVTKKSALAVEYIQYPDVDVKDSGSNLGTFETTSLNIGYRGSF
jgi:hypothetical protein